MTENLVYFKICKPDSIIMFYYDITNDSISGIIEETKKEGSLLLKYHTGKTYNNVVNNEYAMSMIRRAKKIEIDEYIIACNVIDSMTNNTEWLIADNEADMKKEVVVAETVYV